MTEEVARTSAAYDRMAARWKLPRALMAGTAGMRAAGKEYLPQEPSESDKAYKDRLGRSVLFNGFRKAVNGVTGKVFSKPLVLEDDVPQTLVAWAENADLTGRNLDTFAHDLFKDGLQTGISHILVDTHRAPRDASGRRPVMSLAEQNRLGMRPYLVHVPAENLIGWRSEYVDGVPVLSQIRIRETFNEPDGAYGERTVDQVRVIWRDRFEVWRKVDDTGKWALYEDGQIDPRPIPLATFYARRTGFMTAEPPLEDLAHLNAQHWQSSSDQRHILHVARVPILFGAGLGEDDGGTIEIGPNRMVKASDPGAKLEFVEHSGAAISAGRDDLKDLEDQMRLMGLEMMLPRRGGDATATASALDSAEVNSQAKDMALAMKDCVENALKFMANLSGQSGDSGGSVTPNTDYGLSLRDAQDVKSLIDVWKGGGLSSETLWGELQRRGVLVDDFDEEEEMRRLLGSAGGPGSDPEDEDEDEDERDDG